MCGSGDQSPEPRWWQGESRRLSEVRERVARTAGVAVALPYYFLIVVRLLKQREKVTEPDFALRA
jgi:hypothetical protein